MFNVVIYIVVIKVDNFDLKFLLGFMVIIIIYIYEQNDVFILVVKVINFIFDQGLIQVYNC